MKKNTLIAFTLISSFCFVSSNKEDEITIQSKDELIGKWNLNLLDIEISVDGNVIENQKDIDVSGALTMQFDFKQD